MFHLLHQIYQCDSQLISRTSLLVLLEDVRNPQWLNKILESRFDEDQVLVDSNKLANLLLTLTFDSAQMVVTAHGDYTPVAEIMATANKVSPDIFHLCSKSLGGSEDL